MSNEQLERGEWLSLARRQAREISTAREEQMQPFQWPVPDGQADRLRPLMFGLPLTWSLAAITLVLLCGVTGTYAFMRHLQAQGPRPKPTPMITPVLEKAPVDPGLPTRRGKLATIAPRQQPAPIALETLRAPKKVIAPKASAKARPLVHPVKPVAAPSSTTGEIIFGAEEIPGGGELILVSPPIKMRPLWSAEEYRKSGRLGSKP